MYIDSWTAKVWESVISVITSFDLFSSFLCEYKYTNKKPTSKTKKEIKWNDKQKTHIKAKK